MVRRIAWWVVCIVPRFAARSLMWGVLRNVPLPPSWVPYLFGRALGVPGHPVEPNSEPRPAARAALESRGIPVTPEVCGMDTRRGDQGPPCALAKDHAGGCDGTVGK